MCRAEALPQASACQQPMQCRCRTKAVSKTLVHEQAVKESSACKAPAQVLPQKMGCIGRPEEVRSCMRRCFSTLCHTCARAFSCKTQRACLLCASDLASTEDCSAASQDDVRRGRSCNHLAVCGSSTEALHLTVLPRWLLCPHLLHLLHFRPKPDCQPR